MYGWPILTGIAALVLYVIFAVLFFGIPSQTVQAGNSDAGSIILLTIVSACLGFVAGFRINIKTVRYTILCVLCCCAFALLMIIQGLASRTETYGTAGWLCLVLFVALIGILVIFSLGSSEEYTHVHTSIAAVCIIIIIGSLVFWGTVIIASSNIFPSTTGASVYSNSINPTSSATTLSTPLANFIFSYFYPTTTAVSNIGNLARFTNIFGKTIDGTIVTDGTSSLSRGSLTSARLVRSQTLTDGTGTITAGSLINFSITSPNLTDGTITIDSGSLTGALLVESSMIGSDNIIVRALTPCPFGYEIVEVTSTYVGCYNAFATGTCGTFASFLFSTNIADKLAWATTCHEDWFYDNTQLVDGDLNNLTTINSLELNAQYIHTSTMTDRVLSVMNGSITGLNNMETNVHNQGTTASITSLKPITTLNTAFSSTPSFYLSSSISNPVGSIFNLVNLNGGSTLQVKCPDEHTLCSIGFGSGATLVKVSGAHCSFACF